MTLGRTPTLTAMDVSELDGPYLNAKKAWCKSTGVVSPGLG